MVVKKKAEIDKEKKEAGNTGRRVTKRQSNLSKANALKENKRETEKKKQQKQQQQQVVEPEDDVDDVLLDDEPEIEKLTLPPLSPGNRMDLVSNDHQTIRTSSSYEDGNVAGGSGGGGQLFSSYEKRLGGARNQNGGKKSPTGILSQGVLTRRNIGGGIIDHHTRADYHARGDYQSRMFYQRNLRGESRLSNYERGLMPTERFYNSRYNNREFSSAASSNMPRHNASKERPSDKIVTFFRSFNSTRLELKLCISRLYHRHLDDVIEDLSKRVFLSERESYIHTCHGTIISDIDEFEDGGTYFFGPPHVYDMMLYDNFRVANSQLSGPASKFVDVVDAAVRQAYNRRGSRLSIHSYDNRSDLGSSSFSHNKPLQSLYGRKQMIKIIVNDDASIILSFMVDEAKHRSMYEVLGDVTDQLRHSRAAFRTLRIDRICKRNGKTIQKVDDLFLGFEDLFAYTVGYYSPSQTIGDKRGIESVFQRKSITKKREEKGAMISSNSQESYNSETMKPVKVNILNNTHILDPPTHDYLDPTFRRARDYHPELQLEWVYGYNGTKCRNNIFVLPSEELLYFVSKVVVIYNKSTKQQRFYTEHTDEICSIDQHPNLWIMATGQASGGFGNELAHIRIWDSKILVTLNTLNFEDVNLRVDCMDFCEADNGVRLATVATQNDEWYLTVWDWEDSIKLSCSDAYFESEFNIKFDPDNKNQLITCGKEHVFFWDVSRDDAVYEIGYFKDYQTPEMITCVDFDENGILITADSNGVLHIWEKRIKKTASIIKSVHHGTIISMQLLPGSYLITSSNSDNKLSLINYDDMIPSQAEVEIPEIYGNIVAIAPMFGGFRGSTEDFDYLKLALGTSTNAILVGSMNEDFNSLVKGPAAELAGLDIHPSEHLFVTAGADRAVTLWSASSHQEVWEVTLDQPCSAVNFSSNGDVIAVGTAAGRWHVYSRLDGAQFASYQCDRTPITCIAYSPDGGMLAVGTSSGSIFYYECSSDGSTYRFHSRCKTTNNEIEEIDWSMNAHLVRFMSANFELFHWDVHDKRMEGSPHILRDVQFETESVPISFQTAGIWLKKDGKEMLWKEASRSNSSTMYAVGATSGSVRIYNYPCDIPTIKHIEKVENNPPYQEVNMHSTEVANIGFLPTDGSLITNGIDDYCIAQWKILRKLPITLEDRRYKHRYPGSIIEPTRRSLGLAASQSKFTTSQKSLRKAGAQGALTAPRLTARGGLVASSKDYNK